MNESDPKLMTPDGFAKAFRARVYLVSGLSSRRRGTPAQHYSSVTGIDVNHVKDVINGGEPCAEILRDMNKIQVVFQKTMYADAPASGPIDYE